MSRSVVRDDGAIEVARNGDKGYEAYQLRMQGMSWEEIANTVGYATGKSASVEVRRYVTDAATRLDKEQREEVLTIELDRLDALLNAVWTPAMSGDTRAVDSCLKIIGTRAKLLALDQLSATTTNVTNNTVVVTGKTEDFIRTLQEIDEQ